MKVHVLCFLNEEAEQTMTQKLRGLNHELVQSASDARVVLILMRSNYFQSALNWIAAWQRLKSATPIVLVECDEPIRIFGSLKSTCSLLELQKALVAAMQL